MSVASSITRFSVNHPIIVTFLMLLLTVGLALLAVLPSIQPEKYPALHSLQVDTDPENMLPEDEAVRVFHDEMKTEMDLHDMVVLGVVNESDPDGVFNPDSLAKVYELTEFAKTLQWEEDGERVGVVEVDLIAPSTVDNIEQGEGGDLIRFEWLMPKPPETPEEAVVVRENARDIPFLDGTLLSEDGKAIALYLPITSKDVSHEVYTRLKKKIADFDGEERYYITGLPVAEDTFGVEMFKQMAISAPLAMVIIFLLLFYFFRKLTMVISPMVVAMVSVIMTMGLLVATGQTVHIMSSMIPIFIVPIAVLDSVHILSEFFDRYQESRNRKETIQRVMDALFVPMLYTSLTTAVGFASLALTPIPPVQVFGIFVAFGVLMAWLWTITFVPAFVMFIREKSLEGYGTAAEEKGERGMTFLERVLPKVGFQTHRLSILFILGAIGLGVVAVYGIKRIRINDNPTKWFGRRHPIRVADRVLNEHFGGTYMAYLTLEARPSEKKGRAYAESLAGRAMKRAEMLREEIPEAERILDVVGRQAVAFSRKLEDPDKLLRALESYIQQRMDKAPDEEYPAWDEAATFIGLEMQRDEVFKLPEVLAYIEELQQHLLSTGVVGKSNSLTDIVKTVHRELLSGKEEDFRIPRDAQAVAQTLLQYQNSHRPQDLWHLVTPDYLKGVIWVQLRSGDNRDMSRVVATMDEYIRKNPPPVPMEHDWFGLTYINVVWQEKMVSGMLQAFLGSFLAVFLMMTLLYRSALWGILCMLPLTLTILIIYGVIGLVGKDYDMPVAVLSALSLGLAVDYAIHFLSRSRRMYEDYDSWDDTVGPVFGEPARAITRNVVVVGVGFLPLVFAPLVPYQTVGIFISSILVVAGAATLLLLPSLLSLFERLAFPRTKTLCFTCRCGTCIVSAVAGVALIVLNVTQFFRVGYTSLTSVSLLAIVVLAAVCYLFSRREKCKVPREDESPA